MSPSFRNIRTEPKVFVISDLHVAGDYRRVHLRVDGLLCYTL